MPLPLQADSLDAIPEAVRGAYVEKNGKFVLDAEIEDTSALKANNAKLIAEKRELAKRAAVVGDRSVEDVMADLELAAKSKEEKAKAEGNYEELKKIHAAELAKATQQLAEEKTARATDFGKREVSEAINTAGGKIKKLLDPVMKHVKVVEVDGELVAQVVDAKGNARIMDGQGTPMTLAQLVEQFKADPDYEVDFAASSATGGGARNSGGGAGGGGMVIIPKDATPQEYRRLKDDAVKRGVPYQVAP